MHAAPLRLVSGWRATKLAPELHRDRLASAVLAGPSGTAQAVYLGLLGLGGTGWTRWDAGPLTTDQKVGGSSPSKRAEHLCMPEAAPGPGGRLRRFRPETELHTRATEVGHDSPSRLLAAETGSAEVAGARVRGPASVSSGAPEHTRRRSSFGPLSAAASCRPSPYFSEVVEMGDGTLTGHLSGGTSSGGTHVGQAGASVTSRPSTKRATSRSGDAALELS